MSTKILEEVRAISSQKLAEKQKASELNYPNLIEKIKQQASLGNTECEFSEHKIDQYSKRLLENDGFTVYATSKIEVVTHKFQDYYPKKESISIWIVKW